MHAPTELAGAAQALEQKLINFFCKGPGKYLGFADLGYYVGVYIVREKTSTLPCPQCPEWAIQGGGYALCSVDINWR